MAFNQLYVNISHVNPQLKIFRYAGFDIPRYIDNQRNIRHHLGSAFYSNIGIHGGINLTTLIGRKKTQKQIPP